MEKNIGKNHRKYWFQCEKHAGMFRRCVFLSNWLNDKSKSTADYRQTKNCTPLRATAWKHLEVRDNYTRVDPESKFPSLSLTHPW